MKRDNLTVLSLFDGMSCARITLDKMGIKPKAYYASELDKFAIKETEANWPDTVHLGDGGSPCQGFSFAGKQLAFDGPRSALFFVYVDILNHVKSVNPSVKFMLENVRMKKEYLDVITEYLGVEPVFINSALVSAQSRQRYYWANWGMTEPEDRGVLLSGIIESGAVDRDKSHCIDANYFKGGSLKNYLQKKRRQIALCQSESRLCVFEQDDGRPIRKLTVVECCRLQGVPDNHFKVSSNTQAYKMLGNGWQCDTIEHIFNCLFESA